MLNFLKGNIWRGNVEYGIHGLYYFPINAYLIK